MGGGAIDSGGKLRRQIAVLYPVAPASPALLSQRAKTLYGVCRKLT